MRIFSPYRNFFSSEIFLIMVKNRSPNCYCGDDSFCLFTCNRKIFTPYNSACFRGLPSMKINFLRIPWRRNFQCLANFWYSGTLCSQMLVFLTFSRRSFNPNKNSLLLWIIFLSRMKTVQPIYIVFTFFRLFTYPVSFLPSKIQTWFRDIPSCKYVFVRNVCSINFHCIRNF